MATGFLWGDESVLESSNADSRTTLRLHEENHRIVHFKTVNFMSHELYLNFLKQGKKDLLQLNAKKTNNPIENEPKI